MAIVKSPLTNGDRTDWQDVISSLVDTMAQNSSTSAYQAALAAARETNSFNANQAAINRQFQQTSAQKAMDFEANQAALDRAFQQTSAQKAMDFEANQAAINRQFQQTSADKSMAFEREMAETAYQRAISDMKKAGLNPLLAYQNINTTSASGASASGSVASGRSASGSRASGKSASGSSASGVKADVASALQVERASLSQMYDMLSLNVNSALAVKRLENDVKLAHMQLKYDKDKTQALQWIHLSEKMLDSAQNASRHLSSFAGLFGS